MTENTRTVQAIITVEGGGDYALAGALDAFNDYNIDGITLTLEKETSHSLELINTPSGQTLVQRWNNGDVMYVHILGEDWEEGEPGN